jgi:hypothetical protein
LSDRPFAGIALKNCDQRVGDVEVGCRRSFGFEAE